MRANRIDTHNYQELVDRMARKLRSLDAILAEKSPASTEYYRIKGKIEGLELALSDVEEAERQSCPN